MFLESLFFIGNIIMRNFFMDREVRVIILEIIVIIVISVKYIIII